MECEVTKEWSWSCLTNKMKYAWKVFKKFDKATTKDAEELIFSQ